jgi:outer membrane immunogenic protein
MNSKLLGIIGISALLAAPAMAADLSVKAPVYTPPPPVEIFSWSGLYIGGNLGDAQLRRRVDETFFGREFSNGGDGRFIGGGQVGYNYQFANSGFVLGAEADFDWAGKKNGPGIAIPAVGFVQVTSGGASITTAAARFGFANDHWLFYGKAGGGWVSGQGITVTNLTTGASVTSSLSGTRSGGLFGVGVEWAFGNNWSAQFEYDRLNLGSRSFVVPAGAPFLVGDTFTSRTSLDMFKVALNYRLGGFGGRGY